MRFASLVIASSFALALLGAAAPASAGSIMGSVHDFTKFAWSGGQVCVPCHGSRNPNVNVTVAPMWSHDLSKQTYTLYGSTTLKAALGQPGPVSRLCLSCHDGTVAVDSYGGNTGAQYVGAAHNLGTNLSDDHPIGFVYDSALAVANGSLFDPAARTVTIGSGGQSQTGTLTELLLYNGKLECTSCHDPHNALTVGTAALLKMDQTTICGACHKK